ncbi:SsaH family type III secretion protein [Yokenella regensburgei ATCC 49455]|jgi:type III secretion system SsaH family protein|uniref:Type III secretion system protein SsaH n=1 Tax=Yokenella regensburgei TaxID=158877 RepID=A0AB38G0S6_9ENTR|nr:EscG/YscG/SsaH family type III secretion system needle protein co-chaperone [Yokenella regensburgei]EHM45825.1 type III secretion system protein, SsaH family [Yokenella regensburgei ATCC 43003]KFD21369.1 SsaH family type III secretion protein [Yokenella regensburgei ATCC 49455]SQA65268.1 type III secretion system protein SsaH [Yokenella regensburgei]SQA66554.1 type III secretion system protein SsaH [Yokenella regensburgei]SUQ05119.1 type III secretion system protein SsaH [Yokenella regensbu
MMLTEKERRLVVEAAFAGINHGLQRQVRAILPALPLLVENTSLQALCRAVLLAGLNESALARQALADVALPEAETVKTWLK